MLDPNMMRVRSISNLCGNGYFSHEGQQLKWFTEIEARNTKLAHGFNQIVDDFFEKAPFNCPD